MKTRMTRLGAFAVFAVSLALFTGTALASNGHGNTSTPPGQAKKDQTPAAQGSTTAQVSTQTTAQASSSSSSNNNSANAPGQKKQAAAVAQASTATPGYKPSSTTSRWTTCSTGGGTGTTATCIGNASTLSTLKPKPDSSKQYGNGTTAAQIANSNGAPSGTVLTGPGNSQPHKVAVCPKKKNKSGGVDVHAVTRYSTAGRAPQQPARNSWSGRCRRPRLSRACPRRPS